jgi:hypothetical protein
MQVKDIIITLHRSTIKDKLSSAFVWAGNLDMIYDNDSKESLSLPFHPTSDEAISSAIQVSKQIMDRAARIGKLPVDEKPVGILPGKDAQIARL